MPIQVRSVYATADPPTFRDVMHEGTRAAHLEAAPYLIKHWKNPIFKPTKIQGDWDSFQVAFPVVVKKAEDEWFMFYGGNAWGDVIDNCQIGLATSIDGVNWERYGKIISWGSPFSKGIVPCDVFRVKDNNTYYMLATGWETDNMFEKGRIYAFTSTDLINWSLASQSPVITTGQGELAVMRPSVTLAGENVRCWFIICTAEGKRQLGFATSNRQAPLNFTRADVRDVRMDFGLLSDEMEGLHLEYVRLTRTVGALRWGLMQVFGEDGSNLRLIVNAVTSTRSFMRGPMLMVQETGKSDEFDCFFAGAHPCLVYDDQLGLYRVYYAGLDRHYFHQIGLAWLNLHRIIQNPPTVFGYLYASDNGTPLDMYSLNSSGSVTSNPVYSRHWKRAHIKVHNSKACTVEVLEAYRTGSWALNGNIGQVSLSADTVKTITVERPYNFKVKVTQGADSGQVTLTVILEGA